MSFRIEHRIGVAAPAEAVWAVISDFDGWSRWNPVYPRVEGRLAIGAPITFALHLPGSPPQSHTGTIVEWVPNTQLIWRLKLMGGLLATTRYFEIEALSDASCILSNGEIFDGLGAGLVPRSARSQLRRAFAQVNEAAKAQAEAAGAERAA